MLSPILYSGLWLSSSNRARSLIDIAPSDLSPGAKVAGVTFVRPSSSLPSQHTIEPGDARVPPFAATDDGAMALAYLKAADNAIIFPGCGTPSVVYFMFTAAPGRALAPVNSSRLVLQTWRFDLGGVGSPPSVPGWDGLGPAIILAENAVARVEWAQLVNTTSASTLSDPGAVALVPIVPYRRSIAPGRTLTFAAVAVFT